MDTSVTTGAVLTSRSPRPDGQPFPSSPCEPITLDAELRAALRRAVSDARRANLDYVSIERQAAKERERFVIVEVVEQPTRTDELIGRLSGRARVDLYRGPLSRAQFRVLCELARGGSKAEIARRLGVTHQMISKRVIEVVERLDVDGRDDAVRKAVELGLLSDDR